MDCWIIGFLFPSNNHLYLQNAILTRCLQFFPNDTAENTLDIPIANFCLQSFIDELLKIAPAGLCFEICHHAGVK